jgi:hypothetical protein
MSTSFLRIETSVRNKLRSHCKRKKKAMCEIASAVLREYLDPKADPRPRRRPRAA